MGKGVGEEQDEKKGWVSSQLLLWITGAHPNVEHAPQGLGTALPAEVVAGAEPGLTVTMPPSSSTSLGGVSVPLDQRGH